MNDIKKLIGNDAELCEKELERLLDKEHIGEGELQRAMRYAVLGGGKRIRAFLVLEFCRLFSGGIARVRTYKKRFCGIKRNCGHDDDLSSLLSYIGKV